MGDKKYTVCFCNNCGEEEDFNNIDEKDKKDDVICPYCGSNDTCVIEHKETILFPQTKNVHDFADKIKSVRNNYLRLIKEYAYKISDKTDPKDIDEHYNEAVNMNSQSVIKIGEKVSYHEREGIVLFMDLDYYFVYFKDTGEEQEIERYDLENING